MRRFGLIILSLAFFFFLATPLSSVHAQGCTLTITSSGPEPKFTNNDTISVSGSNITYGNFRNDFHITVNNTVVVSSFTLSGDSFSSLTLGTYNDGVYTVTLWGWKTPQLRTKICETAFTIAPEGGNVTGKIDICQQNLDCKECMLSGNLWTGRVWTAVGCIDLEPRNLVTQILRVSIGLAGGIAILIIILGGIKILTSAGNPEGIKSGGETISSALMGLLFIIFSLFLLKLIGIDILNLPGFGIP
jgi:hypothetical protein